MKIIQVMLLSGFLVACSHSTNLQKPASKVQLHKVQVTVTVPPNSPAVYLAGNLPVLGPWHPQALKLSGSDTQRTASFKAPHGHNLSYKVTAGSWEQEGLGPSGTLLPAFTATIDRDKNLEAEIKGFRVDPELLIADWQASGVIGELVYWKDIASEHLQETRHIVTWLPPGYDPSSNKKYKVIYAHDGQNLFDPRLSYTNVDWGIDEAMMKDVEAGKYEAAIVVGIWNTPRRLIEYSPWHEGPQYAQFIIQELMPKIEAQFNVLTGPKNTFTLGSSMGGLISFHLVQQHPDKFGACGCVSSHFTWSNQMLEWYMGRDPTQANPKPLIEQAIAEGLVMPKSVRTYFDYGTQDLDAAYAEPHAKVKTWLKTQGFNSGTNFKMEKFEGAGHNESAWRERVGEQLEWLLVAE